MKSSSFFANEQALCYDIHARFAVKMEKSRMSSASHLGILHLSPPMLEIPRIGALKKKKYKTREWLKLTQNKATTGSAVILANWWNMNKILLNIRQLPQA